VTSAAVGEESMDQPTTRRESGVEYDGAVDLALAGVVLGDVLCRRSNYADVVGDGV